MQEIKERIQKLLALAGSPNEHEAAAAATKAQQLLTLHNLELADLGGDTSKIVVSEVDSCGKVVHWKLILLRWIAGANNCFLFARSEDGLTFMLAGKEAAIAVSKQMYDYLVEVIYRLAKEKGGSRCFRNGFRVGCAERLGERIIEAVWDDRRKGIAARDGFPARSAIVVKSLHQKEWQEVQEYVKQNLNLAHSNSKPVSTLSSAGRRAGREAGDRVSLSK